MTQFVKQLAVGFAAAALAVLGFSGINSGIAATEVGGSDSAEATTSASADTLAACSWFVTGLAPSLELENGDDMEYVGNDYALSASDEDIDIFFSGSDTPDQRCSFYDDEKGVSVEVSWAGTSFSTGTSDASMDFAVGDPLEDGGAVAIDITYEGESCNADWAAGDAESITSASSPPLMPASISNGDVSANYSPTPKSGATFASCRLNATFATKIPGNKTPASPGTSYSFDGPTITTTVAIND